MTRDTAETKIFIRVTNLAAGVQESLGERVTRFSPHGLRDLAVIDLAEPGAAMQKSNQRPTRAPKWPLIIGSEPRIN